MSRVIVHLDADAFFASVEQAADKRLRGKPIAVGGERRGIIASASYEARKVGVYTPMPTARARKLCPKLIVLPGDFERYEQFSNWMFGYCYDFTPEVEQTSIDEGYFDLTSNHAKPHLEIARTVRQAIRQSLKISVSEGIASNKLVSQIASKLNKPAAFESVPPGHEIPFLHPLPNRWLPGVGPKTAIRLNSAGLALIRHIAETPLDLLELLLGSQARQTRQFANGVDDRRLIPVREPQKTFSQQETFAQDLTDEGYVEAVLRRMADQLFAKVRAEDNSIRTLTVKVRYNDMAEDQCSESLPEPTDLETDVYGRLRVMLQRAWKRRVSLRLVSLKLANIYRGVFRTELALDRGAEQQAARERLARVVDELRRVRGPTILLRGHDFRLKEKPVEVSVPQPRSFREPESRAGILPAPVGGADESSRSHHALAGQARCLPYFAVEVPGPEARPTLEVEALHETPSAEAPPCPSLCPAQSGAEDTALQTLARDSIAPEGREAFGVRRVCRRFGSEVHRTGDSRQPATLVPLRVHSYYSFLDSTLSPRSIVELARRHGCPAVALTDAGNLHGAVEFAEAAKQAGIKPVFGAELCVGRNPLVLYVENARGYHNLCCLLSRQAGAGGEASVAAQQVAPVTREALAGFTEGLIAAGADVFLAELFPGRFYQLAADRNRRDDLPAVACPSVRYATPEDRLGFDIVQSIRTRTLLRQAHPAKRRGGRYHFRTPAEMAAGCRERHDWLSHAREIADRCSFELPLGKPQFPAFRAPDGSSSRECLRRLVWEGLHRRYHNRRIVSDTGQAVPLEAVRQQIETELSIIAEVGYEDLFLITWDLLQECRAHGIEWITRGSAADSLVCYCLGISDVCPVRFGLYFRRFLNKERMAMHKLPDIDVDFPHDRKDDVVNLLFKKYGPEHCAVVGGFSTFQARSAVADVAKVLGVSEFQIRRFTEHFPWSFGGGWMAVEDVRPRGAELIEKLKASPECRDLPLEEEPFRTAVEMAAFLEGFPRHPKMHPCGVVLSRQPMRELTPTFISNKGWPTTHFDMDAVEAVGLVKMDILAQGGLAVMRDARESLAARGVRVDWERFTVTERNPNAETDANASGHSAAACQPWGENDGVSSALCLHDQQRTVLPSHEPVVRSRRHEEADLGCGASFHLLASAATGLKVPMRDFKIVETSPNPLDPPAGLGRRQPPGALAASKAAEGRRTPGRWRADAGSVPFRAPVSSPAADFADPEVWDMIAGGNARAVHHIESPAMTSLCRMCNVREIDGLVAIVSVIRPGAANEQKKLKFTRRYQGMEPPEYPHPSLEPCLRSTFGLVVYEEHILQICEAFAGLNPGRADVLRRALVKQKWKDTETIAREFAVSARARGHSLEKIKEVWELVTGFNGYAFCKAHSTAYGVEAYQAAWLKRYFPAEFMAGVLTNGKGFYDPLVYVLEGHRLGLKFLPPDINRPGPAFAVESGAIRVPAVRAKGLRERTIERILAERKRGPFTSLADFQRRAGPLSEEMEILIRLGAFDGFGRSRTAQFWEFQQWHRVFGQSASGQGWLLPPEDLNRLPQTSLREPTRRERLEAETELLGFAVSGHPLELFSDVAWDTYCPVSRLGEHVGEEVVTCGLIVEQRTHHQITGEPMKFLTLADWTGMVETELFAATYRSYGLATVRYAVLEIAAKVEPFENGRGFSLRVLRAGKPRSITPRQPAPDLLASSEPAHKPR